MDILTDLIDRCHKRYEERDKLRQRKTVVTPQLYHVDPYHYKVHCARGTPIMLSEFERAGISFMPIGHAPDNDNGPVNYGGDRFTRRQGIRDWHNRNLHCSWGIQIYTGIPSEQYGALWHDFYFTYQAISAAPDAIYNCIEALTKITPNPLLVLTKSGGLRFTFRISDYLHPHTDAAKYYIYKHTPTENDPLQRDVYLQIRGDKGYSKWDVRYEILVGNLLAPPVITKELVFAPIDALRSQLHTPSIEPYPEILPGCARDVPSTLGSDDLDLAKDALLKHGYSYFQPENQIHYWTKPTSEDSFKLLSLWEDRDIVWVRAPQPDTEFPSTATPITDVLDGTGITPKKFEKGLRITDKILAIREDKLSPLAVKRAAPKLHLKDIPKTVYQSTEEKEAKLRDIFNGKTRLLWIIPPRIPWIDHEIESYIQQEIPICINIKGSVLIASQVKRYRELNIPQLMRWKARKYRWEQVKDIPEDERMANPFQNGNVCEDPERCFEVEKKGGDAHEVICPKCPVFEACKDRGYLSQKELFRNTTLQMVPIKQLFTNPRRGKTFDGIIDTTGEDERVYILYQQRVEIDNFFLECRLPKQLFEQWVENWDGHALGNFAKALLNALEPENDAYNSGIARIRAVIQAFRPHAADLIQQMCYINIRAGTHHLQSEESEVESANSIMRLEEMISAGILDPETVENIKQFPSVSRDPDWTYWHELQHLFDHYQRDSDVPMRWSGTQLLFWLPPMLHPSINHLLLVSPTLSSQHLPKVFPSEAIEVVRTAPKPWQSGNQVFQIRTDINAVNLHYKYDAVWEDTGCSDIVERILLGIRAEIDHDPSIKHVIITTGAIMRRLADLKHNENVCDVMQFGKLYGRNIDFQDAEVLWMIGIPHLAQHILWWNAQMLFGNDEVPLNYDWDGDTDNFIDERIQGMYQQIVTDRFTQIVSQFGLENATGKRVVLFVSTPLPGITDRKETSLFDWEDFEIAGGLDKLPEVIATRERFESERDNMTAETPREEVERIMGCSSRHANYLLKKLRGGNIPRVTLREQILFLLSTGEKKTSVLVSAIDSSPQAISNELKRLMNSGEIVRVQRAIYALPE